MVLRKDSRTLRGSVWCFPHVALRPINHTKTELPFLIPWCSPFMLYSGTSSHTLYMQVSLHTPYNPGYNNPFPLVTNLVQTPSIGRDPYERQYKLAVPRLPLRYYPLITYINPCKEFSLQPIFATMALSLDSGFQVVGV